MVRQTETAALRKAGKASNAKNKTTKVASSGSSNSNTFARGVVGVFSPGFFESVSLPIVFFFVNWLKHNVCPTFFFRCHRGRI